MSSDTDQGEASAGASKLMGGARILGVAGASFAASWFFAPSPSLQPAGKAAHAVAETAMWQPPQPARTVELDPLILSAGEAGATLRIGIALELTDAAGEIDMARLRDAFTHFLRALDPASLTEPRSHAVLKRELLHRARVVLGMTAVLDVLITDYLIVP